MELHDINLSRRELLAAGAAISLSPLARLSPEPTKPLLLPGPFRGSVIEVKHPGAVESGKVNRDAVRAMMTRGMRELTGATNEAAAWKRFFKPGETVGIKISPVGRPLSISQPETVLEVIRGLNMAGIPNKHIIVYNRYESEYRECPISKTLPEGVREAFASREYDEHQVDIEGYDPQVYIEMPRVMTGHDPKEPAHRRSHLAIVLSASVDKMVNISTLKDHASAGITMALKNLSHGSVNNVCRTHASASENWCDIFIPKVVSMRPIREKVALHIGDGLIATYDGGPGIWNKHFRTWEYRSMFFATDPVAMDRVGWDILDRKRAAEKLPLLAETGKKAKNPGLETFDRRQPEHVLIAAKMGLGEGDLKKIAHRVITLPARG
jgi:hypothetical protein